MPKEDNKVQTMSSKLDQKKRLHILLPTGEKEIIELTDDEINTAENWFHLVGKHKIRLDIMNILQIYVEMNITRLSQYVEQSKSTVERHLKSMEKDGLLESRIAEPAEYEKGQIPPRFYRRNTKLIKVIQYTLPTVPEPTDLNERLIFYQNQIDSYREYFRQFIRFFEMTELIFKVVEDNLDNPGNARDLWMKYIEDQLTPSRLTVHKLSISEKYYEQILDEYKGFLKKIVEILAIQNADPEVKAREFSALFTLFPLKDMYDLFRKDKLKERK